MIGGFFMDDVLKFYENYDEDGRLATKYGLVGAANPHRVIAGHALQHANLI